MTRAASVSAAIRTTPLAATRRPVIGPGAALNALVRTPAASTAASHSVVGAVGRAVAVPPALNRKRISVTSRPCLMAS